MFATLGSLGGQETKTLSNEELAAFLGDTTPSPLTWTKFIGSDFELYHGAAVDPATAVAVGLYVGPSPPQIEKPAGAIVVDGKVGRFDANWTKYSGEDGLMRQETIVAVDDIRKVHIWIEARSEDEIKTLIGCFARMPLFAGNENPSSAGPGVVDEHLHPESNP